MTLTELHSDPQKLAAFMGWPYEADEVNEVLTRGGWRKVQVKRRRTAEEATRERYEEYKRVMEEDRIRKELRQQSHDRFVRECAREALGIKGRNVGEVIAKCLESKPEIFQKD